MTPKFAIKRAEPVSTDSSRLGSATQRLGLPLTVTALALFGLRELEKLSR